RYRRARRDRAPAEAGARGAETVRAISVSHRQRRSAEGLRSAARALPCRPIGDRSHGTRRRSAGGGGRGEGGVILEGILQKVDTDHPAADLDLIRRSYEFAAKAHDGQLRRSGDPYVVHPLGVAATIAELKLDVPSVCAGLLHDCVEDTTATTEELNKVFGAE